MAGALVLVWAQIPQTPVQAAPRPAFSLSVSPTRLVIPPGALSATQKFTVINGGRSAFDVTVDKSDFTASENGVLSFRPDAPYAAADWVRADPTRFRLEGGAHRDVTFRVRLPRNAEPGEHQFALIFKVPAGRNAANIRINRGIAAPVFISVPGAASNATEITDLDAPGFAMHGPVALTTRVRDIGTVHRDFRGKGRLYAHVAGTAVGFPDFTVLRDSTREVTAHWKPPVLCVCHATVAIPGPHGTLSEATARIVIFPVYRAAATLAAILVLLLFGLLVRRRYRAKVIATARRMAGDLEDEQRA